MEKKTTQPKRRASKPPASKSSGKSKATSGGSSLTPAERNVLGKILAKARAAKAAKAKQNR